MDSSQAQLIGEQLNHLRDNINARLDHLENLIQHKAQIDAEQKAAMRTELADLREICRDHEIRLRDVASGGRQWRDAVPFHDRRGVAGVGGRIGKGVFAVDVCQT